MWVLLLDEWILDACRTSARVGTARDLEEDLEVFIDAKDGFAVDILDTVDHQSCLFMAIA